jgi:hypothetical protein
MELTFDTTNSMMNLKLGYMKMFKECMCIISLLVFSKTKEKWKTSFNPLELFSRLQ